MSRPSANPTFVATFPLKADAGTTRVLDKRFAAAGNLYNGVLGEAIKRATRMRNDPGWKATRKMPKATAEEKKARSAAFAAVRRKHQFGQYELQKYAEAMRDNSWIDQHLGSHDTQTTSLRAYRAVSGWVYNGKGQPHFKPRHQTLSVEGKSNKAVIRLRNNLVHWNGLQLPLMLVPQNRDKTRWQADALACPTKYVRIVRRKLRGRHRYYAQLVQAGKPPSRGLPLAPNDHKAALDRGPSKIDVVVENTLAATLELAPFAEEPADEVTRSQRAMDRSRRATNPQNYNPDGTNKKGRKQWHKSRPYLRLEKSLAESKRKQAAERKREHGELAHQCIAQAIHWKEENISDKSFQKNFGRSVHRRGGGTFVKELQRKAENAGGSYIRFNTRTTRLSQYDHTTDTYTKKPLSQRIHVFGDGKTQPVSRDLYSAFLALHGHNNLLDTRQVKQTWPSAEPLLAQPVFELPLIRKRSRRKAAATSQDVRADRLQKGKPDKDSTIGSHLPRKLEQPTENPCPGNKRSQVLPPVIPVRSQNPLPFRHGEVQAAMRIAPRERRAKNNQSHHASN